MVQVQRYPPIEYGSELRLRGDLEEPSRLGSSGYAAFLKRGGVLSVMAKPDIEVISNDGGSGIMRVLLQVKERGRETINRILPEPHAALLTGILLGDDSGIPRTLSDDFRRTGMTHIIAISGFNIAILIALLDRTTRPFFPRRLAAIIIMIMLLLYAAMVGGSASVVRATLMGISYLIGLRLLGRPTMVVAGLFTASFLMTLVQPATLWDAGFQLSFAATLGLVLYADPWTQRLDQGLTPFVTPELRPRVVGFMAEVGLVTLAAQLLTIPLIIYHFGRLSLASIPANILVLPAQPGVMMAGGLATMIGFVNVFVGQLVGLIAWFFLHYTIYIVRLLAQMPGASIPLALSSTGMASLYLIIFAGSSLSSRSGKARGSSPGQTHPPHRRWVISLVGLGLLILMTSVWMAARPDGRLHVAFLDVGQGDAIFVQTPAGQQVLIDGGRYTSVVLDQLGRQMPFWDRSIDIVIATHPDADHVAGLVGVFEHYRVSRLITNGAAEGVDPIYDALLLAAEAGGVPVVPAQAGELIKFDNGVLLEVLSTGGYGRNDNRNEGSVVAMLTYGELSVLLTGDAETIAEDRLLRSGSDLDAVILKAGHHGSNGSSSEAFLQAVSPQMVIISAGQDNSYGHPHPAMLERAAAVGAVVLRTDLMGTIEVKSDGQKMWWEVDNPVLVAPAP